jgi:hypothetical protein
VSESTRSVESLEARDHFHFVELSNCSSCECGAVLDEGTEVGDAT